MVSNLIWSSAMIRSLLNKLWLWLRHVNGAVHRLSKVPNQLITSQFFVSQTLLQLLTNSHVYILHVLEHITYLMLETR
jgi:hypothetical protein